MPYLSTWTAWVSSGTFYVMSWCNTKFSELKFKKCMKTINENLYFKFRSERYKCVMKWFGEMFILFLQRDWIWGWVWDVSARRRNCTVRKATENWWTCTWTGTEKTWNIHDVPTELIKRLNKRSTKGNLKLLSKFIWKPLSCSRHHNYAN